MVVEPHDDRIRALVDRFVDQRLTGLARLEQLALNPDIVFTGDLLLVVEQNRLSAYTLD